MLDAPPSSSPSEPTVLDPAPPPPTGKPPSSERGRAFADLPARTALRIANHPRVRPILATRYDRIRARHAASLPDLPIPDRQIVADLDRRGIAIRHLDTFRIHGSERVVEIARRLADGFAGEARRRVARGEDFVVVPGDEIVAEPFLYHFGLGERLLGIAETYLGLPAGFDGVTINYTVADGRAVSTRRWHRDWEDRRMLKVAIYLNDVDAAGGPFEMIPQPTEDHDDRSGFRYGLETDATLPQRFDGRPVPDAVSCKGPAGTIVFTDTARFFHRGRPATGRDRAAIFYSYFARRPRHPFLCERTGLTRSQIDTLSRGLPPRQRRAALWRRELPLWLRLIPPARL